MSECKPNILVVEDEPVGLHKLVTFLRKEGFAVQGVETRAHALKCLSENVIDMVLLDINLPDGDGLQIAGELRARSDIGIIMITGKTDQVDRIAGIEVGADDYITKPYDLRELLARIRGLLRRLSPSEQKQAEIRYYEFGPWKLDLQKRLLTSNNDAPAVALTRSEYDMLHVFLVKAGEVLSRDFLMLSVFQRSWSPDDRSVDMLVARLRSQLEEDPKKPRFIVTSHGKGYIFVEDRVAR